MEQRILVIGLGRLGESLIRHLHEDGVEVIALDNNKDNIDRAKDFANVAVVGDSTDIEVLREIGAPSVDLAVISIGESFESSVLTLTNLQELKVKKIAVRASTAKKAKIFKSIGAENVFYVEEDMGKILAHQFSRPSILHTMELGYGLKIVEWSPPAWTWGKSLKDLQLPQKHRVQIVALRNPKQPKELLYPSPEVTLEEGLLVLMLGSDDDLQRLIESK